MSKQKEAKEGILKNTLVGHFDNHYWCLRPVICFLSESSLMFWDLNGKPENLDLASVLILWVFNQSPFPLCLVSPFVKTKDSAGEMKGPCSFDSAHILIHLEPNGTPWNSSLESEEKQRRDDELVVHLPAPQWRQVINSVITLQNRGQPVWEIHAGMFPPGWLWKSLRVEHFYLQNDEGAWGGQAHIWCQIYKGHFSQLMESTA